MSIVIEIANAVVTELNGAPAGTFNQSFTAVRGYKPQFDLAELKTLRVTVVPRKLEIVSLSRSANQNDVSVDVAVQKKPPDLTNENLDPLMQLVEQMADFFRLRRLTVLPTAIWNKTENVPIYLPEHLESKQVFTSVLTFTFRIVK